MPIDYNANRNIHVDSRGSIAGVSLSVPAGTALPARLRAYVMVDAFPLGSRLL